MPKPTNPKLAAGWHRHTPETGQEEGTCKHCGAPLYVGEPAYYSNGSEMACSWACISEIVTRESA